MAPDAAAVRKTYAESGQSQVFATFDSLSSSEQSDLLSQLASIDPTRVNGIFKKATSPSSEDSAPRDEDLAPPPKDAFESLLQADHKEEQWRQQGLQAIRDGKVAVLLLAGGQGTRLGSSAPKGCYDIRLPSGKSLFQLQAEKIKRLQALAGGATIPWYIMTSGPTRKATEDFFRQHSFFGLDSKHVLTFEQGVLPAFTNDGKFILETPSKLSVAPDGNGGLYAGLRSHTTCPAAHGRSVLEDLSHRGIQYVHAYCVDNCLVKVADPVFLGYCISKQADCGCKVVPKTDPKESVGVVALKRGKWAVVEYSEISKELSERREDPKDPKSPLTFRAGNIANHFYTVDFLARVESFEGEMAYHIAKKKIPHYDPSSGQQVKPSTPNGIKLELFIFDVFPFTERMAVLEVARQEEFSPLKNAPGTGADDPETSRRDLLSQQKRWLEGNAGVTFGKDDIEVELSPLVSYAGEGLEKAKGKKVTKSAKVETEADLDKLD